VQLTGLTKDSDMQIQVLQKSETRSLQAATCNSQYGVWRTRITHHAWYGQPASQLLHLHLFAKALSGST
jgi:hypothetical protein